MVAILCLTGGIPRNQQGTDVKYWLGKRLHYANRRGKKIARQLQTLKQEAHAVYREAGCYEVFHLDIDNHT